MFRAVAAAAAAATLCFAGPAAAQDDSVKAAADACIADWDASGTDCDAVVAFGRCISLAGVHALKNGASVRVATEAVYLEAQKQVPGCDGHDDKSVAGKSLLRNTRGDVKFDLHEGKDVKLFRFRRETVSVFDLADRLTDAEAEGKALAEAVDVLTADVKETNRTLVEFVQDTVDGVVKDQADKLSKFQKEVNAHVADAVKNLTEQMTAMKAEVDSTVNELKEDIDDNVKGAIAEVNLPWKQCTYSVWNRGSDSDANVMTCYFDKERDDTVLKITHHGDIRVINSELRFEIKVDDDRCVLDKSWNNQNPDNKNYGGDAGRLEGWIHDSRSGNRHANQVVQGYCGFTNSKGQIKKGRHKITLFLDHRSNDIYYGWHYPQRMLVEEVSTKKEQDALCSLKNGGSATIQGKSVPARVCL
jgi:hypothetical protein